MARIAPTTPRASTTSCITDPASTPPPFESWLDADALGCDGSTTSWYLRTQCQSWPLTKAFQLSLIVRLLPCLFQNLPYRREPDIGKRITEPSELLIPSARANSVYESSVWSAGQVPAKS